ncbi:hypothetical protein BU26DRAFT_129780 [Trematosphaeria pertusa]|uniref:Uncharacterized protein n=1 Tax=Trematosphaeria pertusa TaxID=390896 RepID=A0A6A6HXX9_9PLEO|nr:uncharacterized protein BU26DRAFT_129780 [Trematosphaeria pertusa]KAF2242638.1 hypothetical protein BU26DRAFT_129780 [Trematosphaeria pertusa]
MPSHFFLSLYWARSRIEATSITSILVIVVQSCRACRPLLFSLTCSGFDDPGSIHSLTHAHFYHTNVNHHINPSYCTVPAQPSSNAAHILLPRVKNRRL